MTSCPRLHRRSLLCLILTSFAAVHSLAAQQIPYLGAPPAAPRNAAAMRGAVPDATSGGATKGLFVDLSTRQQSLAFYQTVYQASENVASGWTGNVAQRVTGTNSASFRDAIALRINYFRAMAGVPATITFLDANNVKDQLAAWMMSVNGLISHTPLPTWIDYTDDGADAASHSNLYLGINGPAAISGYVEDPGDNNTPVGHRRYILYPQTQTMGTGDVDGTTAPPYFSSANALWVFDANYYGSRPAARDGFVAWPPPGYVPYMLIYPRWSISYPNADFSQASVSMTTGGRSLAVVVETPHVGYGENTLVWTPQGLTLAADDPSSAVPVEQQEPTIHVTVSNVLVNGSMTSYSYDVKSFDPQQAGTGQPPTFFASESALGGDVYYLAFAKGNVFGYYQFLSTPGFVYHFDMGFEYVLDAKDGRSGAYLYDFASGHWLYTSPTFAFPYLYDFKLRTFLYYFPDPANPQRYNTDGKRYFYRFDTGATFGM